MNDEENVIKWTEHAQSSQGWNTEIMLMATPWDSRSNNYYELLSEQEEAEGKIEHKSSISEVEMMQYNNQINEL